MASFLEFATEYKRLGLEPARLEAAWREQREEKQKQREFEEKQKQREVEEKQKQREVEEKQKQREVEEKQKQREVEEKQKQREVEEKQKQREFELKRSELELQKIQAQQGQHCEFRVGFGVFGFGVRRLPCVVALSCARAIFLCVCVVRVVPRTHDASLRRLHRLNSVCFVSVFVCAFWRVRPLPVGVARVVLRVLCLSAIVFGLIAGEIQFLVGVFMVRFVCTAASASSKRKSTKGGADAAKKQKTGSLVQMLCGCVRAFACDCCAFGSWCVRVFIADYD